jgi:hypothetical protein
MENQPFQWIIMDDPHILPYWNGAIFVGKINKPFSDSLHQLGRMTWHDSPLISGDGEW